MTLVWLALCWTAGILFGRALQMPVWPCCSLAAGAAWALILARSEKRWRLPLACLLALTLGGVRMGLDEALGAAETLQHHNGQGEMSVVGWICDEPSVRAGYVQLTVCAETVDSGAGSMPITGRLITTAPRYADMGFGQEVRLTGALETPPSSTAFDYREYLLQQGVRSVMRYPTFEILSGARGSLLLRTAYRIKGRLRLATEQSLPDPEAGLLNGILLGLGHTLPEELYEGYRRVGLTHIIVISGFNVSLVVQFVLALAGRVLHRWRALWISLGVVCLYALFVGPTPPVVRAAIMAGASIIALRLGRRAHLLTSVAIASLLMSVSNPLILWSVSYQLSFASTLALALLEPRLAVAAEHWQVGSGERNWSPLLRELLLATLAAQLATLPIVWSTFGEVSLISLLANVLVLPAQGGIMLLGWPVPLLGSLSPALARMVGIPAWLLLRWSNLAVDWLARLRWAAVQAPALPGPAIWAFYGVLVSLALWPRTRRDVTDKDGDEWRPVASLGRWRYLVPAVGVLLVMLLTTMPDGRLHVYVLDVGQGDAILVRTPQGRTALIDGGPDPLLLTARLGRSLPFWQNRLDLVVSTHADGDHLGGLIPVAQRYRVKAVLASPCMAEGSLTDAWQAALQEQGVVPLPGVAGTRVELEPGVELRVLHPGSEADCEHMDQNDASVVCLLSYGRSRILLTGDASATVERELVDTYELEGITLLKVGHHGAAASTSEALLSEARPQVGVVSVGRGNDYGHPAPAALERLTAYNVRVLRTDELGTVEFVSDGSRYWIRSHTTLASEVSGDE